MHEFMWIKLKYLTNRKNGQTIEWENIIQWNIDFMYSSFPKKLVHKIDGTLNAIMAKMPKKVTNSS